MQRTHSSTHTPILITPILIMYALVCKENGKCIEPNTRLHLVPSLAGLFSEHVSTTTVDRPTAAVRQPFQVRVVGAGHKNYAEGLGAGHIF